MPRFGKLDVTWGSRTYLMGIVNVTPDSFSGDGRLTSEAAIEHGLALVAEGADLLDIGGESSRPGHTPVAADEELRRVLPVIEGLASRTVAPLSIDTWKAPVARAAIEAGALLLNDIWGLQRDAAKARLVPADGGLVLMHNRAASRQAGDLLDEIVASLRKSAALGLAAGIPAERIILDPGIGFGKTWQQNLEVLRRLGELRSLGHPLLVGTSRKSTIGLVLDLPVDERLEGTAATVALAIREGADIVRVHDVAAMRRVARMADAIVRGPA